MKSVLQKLSIPGFQNASDRDGQMFAAVDLGSNSFHMIVARHEHGELVIIDRLRDMVRLAAGLDGTGNLNDKARKRALDSLARFGQRLREVPESNIRAAATNTLRRTRDPRAFLRDAEEALGHPIEVVSGHEEARLVYLGVSRGLAEEGRQRLVIDIGGGSSEFIIGRGPDIKRLESLQIGCVTLTRRFFADGDITRRRFREAEDAVAMELEPIVRAYRDTGWDETVGSSGSVRTVRDIAEAEGWEFRGVDGKLIKRVRRLLLKAGQVRELEVPGLSEERSPVFPAALAILSTCFELLGIEHMRVSPLALREGLLYDLLGRLEHRDPREVSIQALASRYGVDAEQAARVHKTVLDCFDQVRDDWGLSDEHRDVLGWAAQVHEAGLAISHSGFHRHGAYLLRYSDLNGFSWLEQQVLSTLVLTQRHRFDAQPFEELPKRLGQSTLRLAVLLRLGVLLHRSRSTSARPRPRCRVRGKHLELNLPDGWLEEHPLTRVDLQAEQAFLSDMGVTLSFD